MQASPALAVGCAVLVVLTSPQLLRHAWAALGRPAASPRGAADPAAPAPSRRRDLRPTVPRQRRPPAPSPDPWTVAQDVDDVYLRCLTTQELCTAWRASYTHVLQASRPDALAAVARCRQGYLDEIERRDPTALQRWLDAGGRAASSPLRFLQP